jgi:hypothetical protein
MRDQVKKLAAKYIDEVIKDQERLGYRGDVPPSVRAEAQRHAESVLEELAISTESDAGSVAA